MSYANPLVEYVADYDFQAEMSPVLTAKGNQIPGSFCVTRKDTDDVMGLVKKNYKILTHGEALNPILELLDKSGMDIFKQIKTTQNGARMYSRL